MRLIHDVTPTTGDAYANEYLEILVGRVTEQGLLDTAAGVRLSPFNSTGYRLLPGLSGDAVGQSVAVQPDGKILIAGRNFTTSTVATAIRVNADGSVDNAFGTNGWLNTDLATGTFDFWFGLTLSWDGKMYLSGTASGDFAAGRYNTFDGFFDGASTHMDQRGHEASPMALWYQQDANFNVTSVSNDAGAVTERYVYAPYGERTALDSGFTPVAGGASLFGVDEGHQGLSADAETGLVYNRARYLHVTLGRFTSTDPLGYVDGGSLFQYVRSDPISLTDSLGLAADWHPSTPGPQNEKMDPRDDPFRHFAPVDETPDRIPVPNNNDYRPWYNCHTDAWRGNGPLAPDIDDPDFDPDSPYWDRSPINQMEKARKLDPSEPARTGDVVVYYSDLNGNGKLDNDGELNTAHSAAVVEVNSNGDIVKVRSKEGSWGVYTHGPQKQNRRAGYGPPQGVYRR